MAANCLTVMSFLLFVLMKLLPNFCSIPGPLTEKCCEIYTHSIFAFKLCQPVMRVRISLVKTMTMPPATVSMPLAR